MKIIGIEPKSPSIHWFKKWIFPRLGLPILLTMLKNEEHYSEMYFEEKIKIDWNNVFTADLILISSTTSTTQRAYYFADRIRKKDIPVILGGSHPTAMPDEALDHADFVIRGEGEYVILPLIKAIEEGKGFENIKGLSYKIAKKKFHNPKVKKWCELDEFPIPDFNIINGWSKENIFPLQCSRGCPENCKFCSVTSTFGRVIRYKSPDRIIEEIKSYLLLGVKFFFFIDDNFAANIKKAKEICRRIIKEKLNIKWTTQVKINCAKDEELLKLMKKAGCFAVCIGIETINPESLKDIKKNQTLEEIFSGVKIFHKNKIRIHGMFVMGLDTDDKKIIRNIVKFAIKKIDSAQFSILTPFPGTEIFEEFKKSGRLSNEDWSKYDAHHVVFKPQKIFPDLLQMEAIRATAKFYSLWQWQAIKMVFKGNWWSIWIKFYGLSLTKKWKKNIKKKNGYLKKLKDLRIKLNPKNN